MRPIGINKKIREDNPAVVVDGTSEADFLKALGIFKRRYGNSKTVKILKFRKEHPAPRERKCSKRLENFKMQQRKKKSRRKAIR